MTKIIDFKSIKDEKLIEKSELYKYIQNNSISLLQKDDNDFNINVVLDLDDDFKTVVDDIIDEDNILVNIIGDITDEDSLVDQHLMYKPRWGDVLNLTAQHLQNLGETNCTAFVFDIEQLNFGEDISNNYLVYFVTTKEFDEDEK